tara:strand:- start:1059 stop:1541 length:483 start_codon:yes stop_codon:yes gene_type:complete
MPSFDIVSTVDHHELDNAIDQTKREIGNRFDFKGTSADLSSEQNGITIYGDNTFQLDQVKDILLQKSSKRSIDPLCYSFSDPEKHQATMKQHAKILEGIETDFAKKIVKSIKDKKLKVQASIQGDQVRVTGKKRDDLQEVITFLKSCNFPQPLQYQNFRD